MTMGYLTMEKGECKYQPCKSYSALQCIITAYGLTTAHKTCNHSVDLLMYYINLTLVVGLKMVQEFFGHILLLLYLCCWLVIISVLVKLQSAVCQTDNLCCIVCFLVSEMQNYDWYCKGRWCKVCTYVCMYHIININHIGN